MDGRSRTTDKSWNEVVLPGGVERLHCPVCGRAVLAPDEGLADPPCGHVLFVHESAGGFSWVRDDHRAAIHRTEAILERYGGGERLFRDTLLADLPEAAIVLELVRPAQGSDDGDAVVVAFDLARAQMAGE